MRIETARNAARLGPATLDSAAPPQPAMPQPATLQPAPLQSAHPVLWRRLAFWVPVATATTVGGVLGVAATSGVASPLRWPLLALLVLNLLYMALTGTPALIGVALHLARRKMPPASPQPTGLSRTAVLMPIHNEDPRTVFTAIETMARAIADAGLSNLGIFVLSDTQDPARAAAEQAAFDALLARAPAAPPLSYRRRASNAGRKVGNLADFCARWGDNYDYMLVLDADSLMGAPAISTLIGLMDANPKTGIIQSVPYPVGRETLFARLQQFSARLYTPLLVEGLTFWQGGDGNYWGHNAIVRIAPFRAHCTIPLLPGREPWGGEILCHDVVEAGMMRGAGWDVWVLPYVVQSFEAVPANMVDFAARERRWCQGNLQHKGLLRHGGFRPVGRFHLAYGIAHYLAGPAALLFLALASLDAVGGGGFASALLSGRAGFWLVALGAVLLYGGKALTLAAALADRREADRFGGRAALLASAAVEQLAACVISALLIVSYTRYVAELLLGKTVRWDAQPRDDRGVTWSEAWSRMRFPALLGLGWLLMLPMMPGVLWAWTLPLLLGLLAAWPLTVLSSRSGLGAKVRRMGLLLTPEEVSPSPVVRTFQRAMLGSVAPGRPASATKLLLVASPRDAR